MENFDLNGLRNESQQKGESLTREERILALEATIARLEEEATMPSPLQTFMTLALEEQQARVAEINSELPEAEQNTVDSYIEELKSGDNVSLVEIRLQVAKQELEELQNTEAT